MATPLKFIRKQLDITQQEIAGRCEVSQAHVSDIENGMQQASPALAERITEVVREKIAALPRSDRRRRIEFSELHVLYPKRYANESACG